MLVAVVRLRGRKRKGSVFRFAPESGLPNLRTTPGANAAGCGHRAPAQRIKTAARRRAGNAIGHLRRDQPPVGRYGAVAFLLQQADGLRALVAVAKPVATTRPAHPPQQIVEGVAVTTAGRSDALPDDPTVGEFVPGYEASAWFGVGAPKGTPAEIVDKLNKEINAGLADPKIKARLADLGGTPLVGSPADFGKLIAEETEKWGKVIRAANIKVE